MIWTGESNGRELRYGQPRNFQRSPNSITVLQWGRWDRR